MDGLVQSSSSSTPTRLSPRNPVTPRSGSVTSRRDDDSGFRPDQVSEPRDCALHDLVVSFFLFQFLFILFYFISHSAVFRPVIGMQCAMNVIEANQSRSRLFKHENEFKEKEKKKKEKTD